MLKNLRLHIVISSLTIILIGSIATYLSQSHPKETFPSVTATTNKIEHPSIKPSTEGFFVDDGFDENTRHNIYFVNITTKERTALTHYPTEGVTQPENVQAIDDNYLGFNRCHVMEGNLNCGIYTLQWRDGSEPKELVHLDKNTSVDSLRFLNQNTFAFTSDQSDDDLNTWTELYLFQNGRLELLKKFEYKKLFSDSSIEAFSDALQFSSDSKEVSLLLNPRGRYSSTQIFTANIESKKIRKTEDSQMEGSTAYFPCREENTITEDIQSLANKYIYWIDKGNGETFLCDGNTGQSTLLISDASHPIWLSETKILISKFDHGVYSEEGRTNGFTQSVGVYDITKHTLEPFFERGEVEGQLIISSSIPHQSEFSVSL